MVDKIESIYQSRDKMAFVFRATFSTAFSCKKVINWCKVVSNGAIDNKPAWFHVMVWHQTGDKPISYTLGREYRGGEKSIFTVVIH